MGCGAIHTAPGFPHPHDHRALTPCARACAAMGFFAFARAKLMSPEVRPFTYGFIVTYIGGFLIARGGTAEDRAGSKFLNPPKHH